MARPSAKEDQKSERRAPLDFPVLIQSLSLCVRPPPPTQWPPADLQGRPSELFTSSRCTGPRVGLARVAQAKPISGCRQRLRHPVYLIVLLQPERAAFAPIPDPGGPCLPACPPHLPGPWWSRRLPPPPRLPLASWPQTSPQGPGPWALQSSPAPGISSVLSSSSFWGVQQLLRLEFCQLKQETRKGCHFNPCDPVSR